jgi:hypothetical protein
MEVWKNIDNFDYYLISNLGRVKSLPRYVNGKNNKKRLISERVLKQYLNKYGYWVVGLIDNNGNKKPHLVHRILATAFIENPDNKRTINHKNGVRSDNSLDNLEWATYSENIKHSFVVLGRKPTMITGKDCWLYGLKGKNHPGYGNSHNKGKVGSKNPNSKKIKCDTLDLCYESISLAAKDLNLSASEISNVCLGKKRQVFGLTFRYL